MNEVSLNNFIPVLRHSRQISLSVSSEDCTVLHALVLQKSQYPDPLSCLRESDMLFNFAN